MKVNNKRIVFEIFLLLIGAFTLLITKDLINKDKNLVVKSNNIKENKNTMAVYVIQDNGEYKQVDDIPQSGYQLNTSKSTCSNGAIPGWDVKTSRFYADNLTKNGTSCYLYFDKYVPTASEIILANLGENIKTSTPDFSKTATTDEGVFTTTDGMYGNTTYYWRGAVENNHVIFANKCWRIIRINGDNTLRLIYNGSIQDNNTCTGNGANVDSIAVTSQAYNSSNNKSYYVGWTQDERQRTNNNIATPSNVKTQIEEWYSNTSKGNLKAYEDKIADGKFCNDRDVDVPPSSFSWGSIYTTTWNTNTGDSNRFAYAGAKRLDETYQPIFSCTNGDVYTLKVGLITADEVEFAGGKNENNTSYYLYNGQNYWTMSPFFWSGSYALVFRVNSYGLLNYANVSGPIGIRPVINLKSDVTFSSGNGEQSTPYIVS